jgi:hypothetical protein
MVQYDHITFAYGLDIVGDTVFALRQNGAFRAAEEPERGRQGVWRLFGIGGSYLGAANFPADYEPYGADADVVLGLSRDTVGIPTVVLYRLVSPF